MAEEEGFDLEKSARKIGRATLLGALQGIGDWVKSWRQGTDKPAEPARGVLILGPGGTGKTTLARLLSGELSWLDDAPGAFEESNDIERFSLTDDPDVEVVVAPGQEYRREATWPGLHHQVASGLFRGIILMNAFGYHSFSTPSMKNHRLWPTTKTVAKFRRALIADRQADELRVLKELVPHISLCKRKLWLLTVVAKQDLWAAQQGAVERHYRSGAYATAVQDVVSALGSRSFRHDVAFVSLILKNLETPTGEKLQTTASNGYDMTRLADAVKRLVVTFESLRSWEAET
jgi:hypothetical protein